MRITELKFGITRNTGDYNSERIDAVAAIGEGEDPNLAMETIRSYVYTGKLPNSETPKVDAPSQKVELDPILKAASAAPAPKEATKKEKKEKKEKVEAAPAPEQKEEAAVAPAPEKEKTPEPTPEEKAPEKKAKQKPNTDTPYSRTNDVHKKLFSELAKSTLGDWKNNPAHVNKVKATSVAMEGEPMLTKEGMISASFKEKVVASLLA